MSDDARALEAPGFQLSIWWLAFGYFACYAPYSALTKAIPRGFVATRHVVTGFELLPVTVLASVVGMFAFLSLAGWWKYATHRTVLGVRVPSPTRWTALSGVCTAAIIMTTTLAYTFRGVSIVFIMLLMRGGVLVIAPVSDFFARRKVRWYSWFGLGLSLVALVVAEHGGDYTMTALCGINVGAYLLGYFVKLRFMSRLAKSADPIANTRYFVEEQMVASPLLFLMLGAVAIAGVGALGHELRAGFTTFFSSGVVGEGVAIGLLSQGTGVFGGLILLDRRENTFCVPVNRTSSVLAGVLASYSIAFIFHQSLPNRWEVGGAALVIGAIHFRCVPPMLERQRARRAPLQVGAVATK
ncbi:MAG: hypothetical protein NVSMB47_08390 [Polyangiales bacterium]